MSLKKQTFRVYKTSSACLENRCCIQDVFGKMLKIQDLSGKKLKMNILKTKDLTGMILKIRILLTHRLLTLPTLPSCVLNPSKGHT